MLKPSYRNELDIAILEAISKNQRFTEMRFENDVLAAMQAGKHYKDQGYALVVTLNDPTSHVFLYLGEDMEDMHITVPRSHTVLMAFPADITQPLNSDESADVYDFDSYRQACRATRTT